MAVAIDKPAISRYLSNHYEYEKVDVKPFYSDICTL